MSKKITLHDLHGNSKHEFNGAVITDTPETTTTPKSLVSGHLADLVLKYDSPTKSGELKAEVTNLNLTSTEHKIILALCVLLNKKSQTYDKDKDNYFSGNHKVDIILHGDRRAVAPRLLLTQYELALEYNGGNKLSQPIVDTVAKAIETLSNKKFNIKYTQKTKEGKQEVINEIDTTEELVKVFNLKQTKGGDSKNTVLVRLNPIFIQQIDSKYISLPNDIINRLIEAYGKKTVHSITYQLLYLLLNRMSLKNYEDKKGILLDNLYYQLAEDMMKKSYKKKVKEKTEEAIETMLKLGILDSYDIVKAKSSKGHKILFNLNKDWK